MRNKFCIGKGEAALDPADTTHGQPADIFVEQGMILMEGYPGLAVTMSADAAEETGRRLIAAAREARGHATAQRKSGGSG